MTTENILDSLRFLIPIVILALEHWLSKTNKVEAGSTVGLVINVLKALMKGKK